MVKLRLEFNRRPMAVRCNEFFGFLKFVSEFGYRHYSLCEESGSVGLMPSGVQGRVSALN